MITNELAKSSAPSSISMLGNELRRAAGIAVDVKFLALMAATPGITSAASTGVTSTAVLADLTARLNALTIGSDSGLWFITSPKLVQDVVAVARYRRVLCTERQDRPHSVGPE